MKKAKNFLLLLLGIGLVIGVAALAYSYLSEEYSEAPDTMPEQQRVLAPDFSVMDDTGKIVSLSSLRGKPVVINFWATWCLPCKEELPFFDIAYKRYGEQVHFMMLNVDGGMESVESAKAFVRQGGYVFPQYFDVSYSASSAYGVSAIPVTLFVDKHGYVTASTVGMINEQKLTSEIIKLLEE